MTVFSNLCLLLPFFGTALGAEAVRAEATLPATLLSFIENRIDQAPRCPPPLYRAESGTLGTQSVWIINYPPKCYEERHGSGYFWDWGGTAGPVFDVFMNVDKGWLLIATGRAHRTRLIDDEWLEIVEHHVACDNTPTSDKGCVTRFRWNGIALKIADKNYESGSGTRLAHIPPRPIARLESGPE